ncbi:PTS sugar transporter subunit IIA [Oceanomicrobium pacificus]|uniref:PTS fructose transporter subunit IIA n=1 Tax=Oceanomicrobium pacificus TaxID=2692916 RepID=A0A6B0TSF8_9RHOB|nr:PTS fructose transporter subunit IIA [Oceanomicrobium pacificus]MXU63943.1 PTS fructose transporter subunit IIA [Oceanomicrobium pacificus]
MIGIVIVAHGGLAKEYLAAMEHVVGTHEGTRAISIGPDDDRAAKQAEIGAAIKAVDAGDGVVVVTDIHGGTPSNLAVAACGRADRQVLCGANLPMLVKLAKARNMKMKDAVDTAISAGRKYINSMGMPIPPVGGAPGA